VHVCDGIAQSRETFKVGSIPVARSSTYESHPKITGRWGANLVVELNIPIELALNLFAANSQDGPGHIGRKGKRSRQIWIVFI
jgi:hypothetical protein